MFAVRNYLLAGVAGIGMVIAGATSGLAGPLELNPNATNGGAGTLDTICNPCTGNYPFFTNNSNTAFTADLHINGTPGSPGIQTATETGSILLLDFAVTSPPGATSNITHNYNVYATFSITGQGTWSGGVFTLTSGINAVVNLIGSPNNNTTSGLNFTTPGPGGTGVLNPGAGSFALGTAQLVSALLPPTASGSCTTAADCTSQAVTSFFGNFTFIPAPGTTGAGGFFVNLSGPFQLAIGAQQGGNNLNTTETVAGGVTDFVTLVQPTNGTGCSGTGFTGNCPRGGGSLSYDVAAVPEPTSLSLLGAGLIGLGALYRRRRRRA